MTQHPYKSAPDRAFWKRAVSSSDRECIDIVYPAFPLIDSRSRVVSAGSCFSAHIARHLKGRGYNYLVTEDMHPAIAAYNLPYHAKAGYGAFSAMYGNIYTVRQLIQLLDRALGLFVASEDIWEGETAGTFVDPFRPTFPYAATSREEFFHLRKQHYAAVIKAFTEADVVMFTLGLTEAWRSRQDGAVFPLCPGVAGGVFDPSRHEFVNFSVDDVVSDLRAFAGHMSGLNPGARVILTVSPVALAATASEASVVSANSYSKAVLRVAAEMTKSFGFHYFPSYEIIAGPQAPDDYFEADRRNVSERGVTRVMELFFRHCTKHEDRAGESDSDAGLQKAALVNRLVTEAMAIACDEELLESN